MARRPVLQSFHPAHGNRHILFRAFGLMNNQTPYPADSPDILWVGYPLTRPGEVSRRNMFALPMEVPEHVLKIFALILQCRHQNSLTLPYQDG